MTDALVANLSPVRVWGWKRVVQDYFDPTVYFSVSGRVRLHTWRAGVWYTDASDKIELCASGFHFCSSSEACDLFYHPETSVLVRIQVDTQVISSHHLKSTARRMRIVPTHEDLDSKDDCSDWGLTEVSLDLAMRSPYLLSEEDISTLCARCATTNLFAADDWFNCMRKVACSGTTHASAKLIESMLMNPCVNNLPLNNQYPQFMSNLCMTCVSCGNTGMLRQMLYLYQQQNGAPFSGSTMEDLLRFAVERGRIEIVKHLVLELAVPVSLSLASLAENCGHGDVLAFLFETCYNVTFVKLKEHTEICVAVAAHKCYLSVLRLTLPENCDPEFIDTLLLSAFHKDQVHIVQYLVEERGAVLHIDQSAYMTSGCWYDIPFRVLEYFVQSGRAALVQPVLETAVARECWAGTADSLKAFVNGVRWVLTEKDLAVATKANKLDNMRCILEDFCVPLPEQSVELLLGENYTTPKLVTPTLRYLVVERNAPVSERAIYLALNNVENLQLLVQHAGVSVPTEMVMRAVVSDYVDVAKYLTHELGLPVTEEAFVYAQLYPKYHLLRHLWTAPRKQITPKVVEAVLNDPLKLQLHWLLAEETIPVTLAGLLVAVTKHNASVVARMLEFWKEPVPEAVMIEAVRAGRVPVVQQLVEVGGGVVTRDVALAALHDARLTVFLYLQKRGHVAQHITVDDALSRGDDALTCFDELVYAGAQLSKDSLFVAVTARSSACYKVAQAQGSQVNDTLCRLLHLGRRDDAMFMIKNALGDDIPSTIVTLVASFDCLPILQHLTRERHAPVSEKAVTVAASAGNLESVRFLVHELQVPIPAAALVAACNGGFHKIVKFLLQPRPRPRPAVPEAAVVAAAKLGRLDILQMLVHYGATVSNDAVLAAASRNHWKCHKYLIARLVLVNE